MRIEFLILRVLILLSYLFYVNNLIFIIIYYLVFVVCEGVLGLTLLVYLIRNNGNDNINLLNLVIW